MITMQLLESVSTDTCLLSGLFFMAGNRGENPVLMRFAVINGGNCDWAIYYGLPDQSVEEISSIGEKMFSATLIIALSNCTDEAFEHYRY